jgi:hypothetical protein
VSGRRCFLALLAVVVVGATVAFVVQPGHHTPAASNGEDVAAVVSGHAAQPAALSARVTAGAEQLVAENLRPRRLAGLTLVALLVLMSLRLRPVVRRQQRGAAALSRTITRTRLVPPRAPPSLLAS